MSVLYKIYSDDTKCNDFVVAENYQEVVGFWKSKVGTNCSPTTIEKIGESPYLLIKGYFDTVETDDLREKLSKAYKELSED